MIAFPCPFCRSPHVHLTATTQRFAHYRCVECAEVWTAMAAPPARAANRLEGRAAETSAPRDPQTVSGSPRRRH